MTATTWGAGEYPLMAERLDRASAAAVDRAGVHPGDRVVDVATGTGNAALSCAARGAQVVGVDCEPSLLTIARSRAAELGLEVRWETADVAALPVPDDWADVVLSVFGVMYASDHDTAARELARCAAPGARVVLASWTPAGFMPAMGRALAELLPPPPPSSGPPSRWGDPEALEELLAGAGLRVTSHSAQQLTMTFAGSAEAADFLARTAGHVVSERNRLTEERRWDELMAALRALVDTRGKYRDGRLAIDLDYLLTSASPALPATT